MIEVSGLIKKYRDVRALDRLDFSVPEGSVLGLLGPNGAGKTTAVSILATLIPADGGTALVAGLDVAKSPEEVRRHIGLSGQYAAVDEHLTGFENLSLIGRLYHLGGRTAGTRAKTLLERFSLTEAADRPVGTYSGGMRRRLDLAGAIVAEPAVLFLDEPTTGLDPRSRIELWDAIGELVRNGTTLLLTTQYMEEAEQLATDIVVIDRGQKIAQGSAVELKSRIGGERIEVTLRSAHDLEKAERILSGVANGAVDIEDRAVSAPVASGPRSLSMVLRRLDDAGIELSDVGLRRPTLDDVFLSLTGQSSDPMKRAS